MLSCSPQKLEQPASGTSSQASGNVLSSSKTRATGIRTKDRSNVAWFSNRREGKFPFLPIKLKLSEISSPGFRSFFYCFFRWDRHFVGFDTGLTGICPPGKTAFSQKSFLIRSRAACKARVFWVFCEKSSSWTLFFFFISEKIGKSSWIRPLG